MGKKKRFEHWKWVIGAIVIPIVIWLLTILFQSRGDITVNNSSDVDIDTGDTKITQTHTGSGDNIAGDKIINPEKSPRHLDSNFKKEINIILQQYNGTKISVLSPSGNLEAKNFAGEIVEYLKQEGYKVYWPELMNGVDNYNLISYISDESVLVFSIGESRL